MDIEASKAEIVSKMTHYMKSVLEPKQRSFGGMPPCPFVRAERVMGKIKYELCAMSPRRSTDLIERFIRAFKNDRKHSTLLIIDPVPHLTKAQGLALGVKLCEKVRDIGMVAICLHPDDQFEIAGFKPRNRIPYVTMLVQAADLMVDAKRTLEKSRYYDNWSSEDFAFNFEQFGRFLKRRGQGGAER